MQQLTTVHAGKKSRALKISKVKIKKMIKSIARDLDAEGIGEIPTAIKSFNKALRDKGVTAEVRRLASNPKVLVSTAVLSLKGGSRAIKSVMTGKSNMRFAPATMMGMIAYVEWELKCGKALDGRGGDATELECGGKGIRTEHNRDAVNTLYKRGFSGVVGGKFKEEEHNDPPNYTVFHGGGHGALFHLSQVAYYQLQYRAGVGNPIKQIEGSRWVYFYENEDGKDEQSDKDDSSKTVMNDLTAFGYNRWIDIVLEVETALGKKEQWIELKSYAGKNEDSKRHLPKSNLKEWEIAKPKVKAGSAGMHKQFSIDRAAATVGHAWRPIEGRPADFTRVDVINDPRWRFQKFAPRKKAPSNKGMGYSLDITSTKKGSVRSIFKNKLGNVTSFPEMVKTNWGNTAPVAGSYLEEASMATLLKDLIKYGFGEAADAAAEEYL
ncbi:hypothetical protein [Reinekea sp.]|uniref:hypothetical protein n=1 Tax=Reinekea sp. TaxID=1970455 RepID=UPI00398A1BF6